MFTPEEAIAQLDDALAKVGQTVTFRRYTAPSGSPRPKTDLDMRAFVRAVKAEEFVGNVDHTFSAVSLSPTGFSPMWPIIKGDKIVIDGRERNVEVVKPIRMNNALVRCNLMVAG